MGLFLLLSSAAACAANGSLAVRDGLAMRAHQDLYFQPTRSIRAVNPPAAASWNAIVAAAIVSLPAPAAPHDVPLAAASALAGLRNRLISADGAMNVPVGVYADCSGNSPIDAARADFDPCFIGRNYFVGHNPGVFSPLLRMSVGSVITWYDDQGAAHPMRIVQVRDFRRNSQPLLLSQPDVIAQFQTCLTSDGSLDRILDAVRA